MKKNKILSPINRYGKNKEKINMELYRFEIQKDVWDVRNLGIPYNTTRSDFYLSFEKIELNFREIIKKYAQERLFVQDSIKFSTARSDVFTLIPFIKFITLKYPNWIDFNLLTRKDMEEYFRSLKSTKITGNKGKLNQAKKENEPTKSYIWRMIGGVENFLYYIQRYEWEEAPNEAIRKLIYQEDRPKLEPKKDEEYEYVSDFVWNQILEKIDKLHPQYITILLLMEATGFRLLDILSLKIDCLIEINKNYWIKSERANSRYENPMVMISENIAEIITAYKELIMNVFPGEKNPNNLLFLRYEGKKGVGKQILQLTFLRQLNNFSKAENILEMDGQIFHFNSSKFQHRFGVKSFEKGLNVAQLQNMIGNVTPEKPMRYARIFQKSKIENNEFFLSEDQENIVNWLVESKENFIDNIHKLQAGFYESTQIPNEVIKTFEQLTYIEKLEVIKASATIIIKNSRD